MNAFRQTLDAYLAGKSELRLVERELTLSLAREPHMAAAHGAYVEALYRSGRIPGETYLALVQVVRQTQARAAAAAPLPPPPPATPPPAAPAAGAAGPADAGEASDKTQFRAPKPAAAAAAPPADAGADKTQFRAPKPAPAPRSPEPVAPVAAGAGADPSWVPTGPPTGTTTGTTTGSTTGTGRKTGSSWSDVSRWAGVDTPPLTAGSVIKERFVLEEEIGRGGMGVVFKARDLRKEEAQDRNPYVAIKLLNEEFKRHPESLKALQRESRKAQNLAHPNVVTVYDFDRDGPNVYMVMELLEGEALDRAVKRVRDVGFEKKEALRMTRDVCRAMAYAHEQGIVHSDFKPANAFLTNEGVVKVFDFGIARAAKRSDKVSGTTTLFDPGTLGALTPAYASCEMIEGLDPDPRDDVYGIACVTYELLTGRHPFDRMSAVQARDARLVARTPPTLSRPQARALQRGLAFRRSDRPSSALEFMNGILPPKRSANVYIAAGAAAVATVVIAAVVVPGWIKSQRDRTLIAALSSGNPASIEPTLPRLKTLDSSERNTVLANDQARAGLFQYFETEINAAADGAQGHYDFPKAETLATSLQALYPDSAQGKDISDRLATRKADEIAHQRKRFDDALGKGQLLSSQGPDSVEAILAIVRSIDPNHALLHDERLRFEYARQIHVALDRSDTTLAQTLVDSGLKLYPNDPALRDLRDQTQTVQQAADRDARVKGLERSLGPLLAAGATLADFDAKRADIAALRSLGSQSRILSDVQNSAQRLLEHDVQSLVSAQKFDDAEKFRARYADLATPAFAERKKQEIVDAKLRYEGKQAEVAQQRDSSIANLKAQIASLLKTTKPDDSWDAALRGNVGKLSAYLPANDPYFAQVNDSAATVYLGEERALRQAQRLTEAERMLERAREYSPQLKALPDEVKLLASARDQQAADTKERERRAQLDSLKAKLLDQAHADDVVAAQASLDQLRKETAPNDTFVTKDGPEAIARSYLSLATRRVDKGGYEDAIKMVDHGRDMVRGVSSPVVTDLDNARSRYTRYLALDRSFATDALPDTNAARSELDQLTRLDARDTKVVRQRLAQTLATRMRAASGARADLLKTAGHTIFPEEGAFAPQPAPLLANTPRPAPPPAAVQPAQTTPPPTPAPTPAATPPPAPASTTSTAGTPSGSRSPGSASGPRPTVATPTPAAAPPPDPGTKAIDSPEPCDKATPGYGRRPKGQCFDAFVGGQGPTLVVIPAMGPGSPFAMGRTEVTNGDYATYCSLSKSCRAPSGPADMPLTSVALADAQHYMDWLTLVSGAKYRLPSGDEWVYAITAKGSSHSPNDNPGSINCTVVANGNKTRGFELEAVQKGPENGWGIWDYVGNAQQWVKSGGTVSARGGAYTDNIDQCTPDATRPHSGSADKITGFRVLREIK